MGKYHLETLSATRESQRISLMGRWRWWGCVGCQILSILRVAPCLYLCMSVSLHLLLWPPSVISHIISLSAPPPHSSITPWTGSQAPCLENKLMFTQSPALPSTRFTHLPRRHCWCVCVHRLQTGSICVAYLSFFSVQPAGHQGDETDTERLIWTASAGTHTFMHLHVRAQEGAWYSHYMLGSWR